MRSALKAFGAALIICTPALAQPADDGNGDSEAINLICTGRGEKLASGYTSSLEWDRYDHKYRTRSGYETSMRGFESAVTLQIYGNDGRIRLPEKLIPPINSGGDHRHWWQLDDLIVGQNEIRASYRLNGLNKPKIRIDRETGEINIKGTGQDFSGTCEKVDPGQRRF
ncbi:hypothetical protein G432_04475 [Sphingomonas sp. MM-1]|nr:hypothetical protein G432_04475 [Sphingomonas sp. MM-1]